MFKIAEKQIGLCATCRAGHTHEYAGRDAVTICSELSPSVTISRPVVRCSDYDNKNAPSKWDMEKIAWTLLTDKNRNVIGFEPPKKEER